MARVMLVLAFLGLVGCLVVARPVDIIGGNPYCQPIYDDVWRCRDDYARVWRCVHDRGRWRCWREPW